MSHEIRTPMTAILSFAVLLAREGWPFDLILMDMQMPVARAEYVENHGLRHP